MSYSFIIGDDAIEDVGSTPLQLLVTLEEGDFNNDGLTDVQMSVEMLSGNIADLRGFFFNLSDDSLLSSLQITGSTVTATKVDTDGDGTAEVSQVGTQSISAVINPLSFEAGVAFGTAGIGDDDLQSITFVLSSPTADFTYDALVGESIGVRATSVGDDREGSSKLTAVVPPPPEPPPPEVFEGLSHGYWKNHTPDWDFSTGASFENTFGVDSSWQLGAGKKATTAADVTLEQALSLQGGGASALAREATAALLNALDEDVSFKFSVDEIKAIVQDAFASGNYDVAKNMLEAENTLGLEESFV